MSHLRRLVNSNCAGVLTMAPDGSDGRDMAALLHAARVPVVWLLSKPKSEYDAPVIQYNDISVSTLSVQHLYNQGYRRIGYVCNHISAQPGMPNMGLAAALRMLNLPIDPAWTLQMHATDEIFIEQVARMLSHPNRPDVLTCFNDTVAASVYEAARRAGLRVGADLGVIGKDKTFTVGLQAFIQENTTNWVNMAAATVLGLIPVLILFLSFQKTFIAGMTSGAVKA